jgi:hypothetical protein
MPLWLYWLREQLRAWRNRRRGGRTSEEDFIMRRGSP